MAECISKSIREISMPTQNNEVANYLKNSFFTVMLAPTEQDDTSSIKVLINSKFFGPELTGIALSALIRALAEAGMPADELSETLLECLANIGHKVTIQ